MKGNFLLFEWDHYYPSGGYNDFFNSYETLEEALEVAETLKQSRNYTTFLFMIYNAIEEKVEITNKEVEPWCLDTNEQRYIFKNTNTIKL